ncbi:ketoacyl-ACP synthase III family protein [Nocardia huaxiensis]|uniref:ketoacyl-ACP synthase III family protein n=1 Tax=Nocardia huaxiensis TaxID=2755382 RepID=UPI001E65CC11|nr:ketoacyl-ACP synthase III family protein [Nocardia huaxiensis]UFS98483.1 ketoacyl-ACP synthase III family protein [Nocardia huaxiensis]
MKIVGALSIKGAAAWLPDTTQTADEAIAAGLLTAEYAKRIGIEAVTVAEDTMGAPDMAVLAGRRAIEDANIDPALIGLVTHSWLFYQGHDLWSPAHYVADGVGASSATAFGIHQMSNGGPTAVQLGAINLMADPDAHYTLATSGDRFCLPAINRWGVDSDCALGDGGGALVLGRSDGETDRLRLLSVGTATAPEFEGLCRGDDVWSPHPLWHRMPIDGTRLKTAFCASIDVEQFVLAVRKKLAESVQQALDHAGIENRDPRIRIAVVPRIGRGLLERAFQPALRDTVRAEIVHLGGRTGHLGAGDLFANITDIIELNLLEPGEIAIIASSGGSCSWSCVVVQQPAG